MVVVSANMDGFQSILEKVWSTLNPGSQAVKTHGREQELMEGKLGQPDGGTRRGNRGGVRRASREGDRVLCG